MEEANVPAEQSVQLDAPVLEKAPEGQSVEVTEFKGQKAPAGHKIGAPEEQE